MSADDRGSGVPPKGSTEEAGGLPREMECREALGYVYEYLDGELDPDTQERIHRHVEICQRCYPYYDFERIFLDTVRDRGLASGDVERLRDRLEGLLERAG